MYISSLGHNKRYPLLCLTANHRCYAVLLTAQAYKTFLMHYSDCITISSPRVLKKQTIGKNLGKLICKLVVQGHWDLGRHLY